MEAKRKPIDAYITWAGDYCKHCFTCINICPVKNLKFEGDEMASLNKCIQCQLCERYCPDFALEVKPKPKGAKPKAAKPATGKKSPAGKKAADPQPVKDEPGGGSPSRSQGRAQGNKGRSGTERTDAASKNETEVHA